MRALESAPKNGGAAGDTPQATGPAARQAAQTRTPEESSRSSSEDHGSPTALAAGVAEAAKDVTSPGRPRTGTAPAVERQAASDGARDSRQRKPSPSVGSGGGPRRSTSSEAKAGVRPVK